jgi:surface antigen
LWVCVQNPPMKLHLSALLGVALGVVPLAAAEFPGLIARHETEALTDADKAAAYRAEREALSRDQFVQGFEWEGPDGATGYIIVGGEFPGGFGHGGCRDFVHIIRHPKDGGVNPTFRGTICRDAAGKWGVRGR